MCVHVHDKVTSHTLFYTVVFFFNSISNYNVVLLDTLCTDNMDRTYLTEAQIEEILRGDLSDIEHFDESETDDENATEEVLQEKLQQFEEFVSLHDFQHDPVCDQNISGGSGPSNIESSVEQHEASLREESINVNINNQENIPLVQRLDPCEPCWRKDRGFTFPGHECDLQTSPPPEELLSPKEYFNKFIDKEILLNFVEQTNLYSVQQSCKNINTNIAEIEHSLAYI